MNDEMTSLYEIYSKYNNIIKYSEYAFTGWFLSWILFFIMLPFMIHLFGKMKGAAVNYGFSWISMVIIILGLEFSTK
jgi:ABC-type multidrug transport system permease subunit